MDDAKPNIFEEIVKGLYELAVEILEELWPFLLKMLKVSCWALAGILVLPCVFVASVIYPAWVKMGEGSRKSIKYIYTLYLSTLY